MSQQPDHVRLGGSVSARLLWIAAAAAIGALAYVVWRWMAPSSFGWLCLIPAVGALVFLRHGVFARWVAVDSEGVRLGGFRTRKVPWSAIAAIWYAPGTPVELCLALRDPSLVRPCAVGLPAARAVDYGIVVRRTLRSRPHEDAIRHYAGDAFGEPMSAVRGGETASRRRVAPRAEMRALSVRVLDVSPLLSVGVLLMIGLAAGLLAVAESTSASTVAIGMVVVLGLVTALVLYLAYWQLPAGRLTIDARGVVVGAGRRESIFGWSQISQVAVRADRGICVRLPESADPPRARLGPGGVRLIGRDAWVLSGRMDASVAEIADAVVVAASEAGRAASVRFHGGASKPFGPMPPAPSNTQAPNQAAEISVADIPDIARKS